MKSSWVDVLVFDLDDTLRPRNQSMPFLEVKQLLTGLKQAGYLLALASLNEDAESDLAVLGLQPFFDCVQCSLQDTKYDMLKKIMEHFNVPVERMVFFDDIMSHVLEARALGITSVLINGRTGVNQHYVDIGIKRVTAQHEK